MGRYAYFLNNSYKFWFGIQSSIADEFGLEHRQRYIVEGLDHSAITDDDVLAKKVKDWCIDDDIIKGEMTMAEMGEDGILAEDVQELLDRGQIHIENYVTVGVDDKDHLYDMWNFCKVDFMERDPDDESDEGVDGEYIDWAFEVYNEWCETESEDDPSASGYDKDQLADAWLAWLMWFGLKDTNEFEISFEY